jgi:lysophospholipase L1-like esterase
MPIRDRTPGTWSGRPGIKVGVLAALVTVAAVVTLTAIAAEHPGGLRNKSVTSTTTPTSRMAVTRVGVAGGISRSITVVGVGDSVTSGFNCSCESFVGLYASQLASQQGLSTSSVNLGVPGWTSSQLLASMTHPGAFRDQVAKADILLVTIGANDLNPLEATAPAGCSSSCYGPLVDSVGRNVALIVSAAQATHPGHLATILVTDYWNVFQDGDVGTAENGSTFQSWSDALTRAESTQVCNAAQRAGAICVGLYEPFKGDGSQNPTSLLAADGDHPNAAGHQLIASTLLASTPQPIP